ncbi:MAG: hypothetical protein IKT71_06075 [Paludibacteraceae bacterium]|nr:hypothetical protein [Paludibacteraceae bacterium]
MRKYFVFLIGLACGMLVSCRTQKTLHQPVVLQADTTVIPDFPAEVLYVLGARWEADTALQDHTIAEYIEGELMRLYPEKAYAGYIDRLCALTDGLLVSSQRKPILFNPHRQEINFLSTASLRADFYEVLDSLSLEEEMEVLELTPQEQADWDVLQSLVHSEQPITRAAFDTLNIEFFDEENVLLTLLLWRGPRLFYRVLQSKARAEKLARYYYGEATNNGRPGDAFKHIYVNVLLRTYVGEWLSHAIMDIFWEWKSPNAPCDHYMDLHNNIIGRQTRYDDFTTIDAQCSDMRHWLQWAENVQHFVQDSVNGDYQVWNKETPTFVVESAAQKISDTQYIYWDK